MHRTFKLSNLTLLVPELGMPALEETFTARFSFHIFIVYVFSSAPEILLPSGTDCNILAEASSFIDPELQY